MSSGHLKLNQCLWIYSDHIARRNLHTRVEVAALRERGAEVFMLKNHGDHDGLERLRKLVWKNEKHVVLTWLHPRELFALKPIFRERKNFSIVLDDWWIIPHWFIREAEYKIFRKYNGIAVRLGQAEFVSGEPPFFVKPWPVTPYAAAAAALRPPSLMVSPLFDAWKSLARGKEMIRPERLLYFPFPVIADSLPLKPETLQYDFTLIGSVCGIWLMRDAFAPFKYNLANLYHDRERLADFVRKFGGKPFKIFDWRLLNPPRAPQGWELYTQIIRQSRFVIATGGLHDAAVAKYTEFTCLGTPAIGRKLPFEYPWLNDCVFEVDIMRLNRDQLKPLLHEAIECYPIMRENCLKWRDRLLKGYEIHRLLDMVQAQADGAPVSADYLTEKGIACEKIRAGGEK